jgi:RNA polymerase sigma-70 factor, ECF subfamily
MLVPRLLDGSVRVFLLEPAGHLAVRKVEPIQCASQSASPADDAALARALVAGEAPAPRRAWERFAPMVRRIARRTLGPDTDVEDIVQLVFMKLFARVHTLREPQALAAFLISITTFTLRRELRRRKLQSWLGLTSDAAATDLRVVHPDPQAREALRRFYALLDHFGARDRTAFVLRFIEGLELQDVADALGVSLATAKRAVTRTQERITRLVERDPALADYLGAGRERREHD